MYLLGAFDLRRDDTGAIVRQPESQRVFIETIVRTFSIAAGVTLLALLIGFPFAYTIVLVSKGWAALLLFVVLLPFWTSVLVRTLSWSVLLQRDGVINHVLQSTGLIDAPLPLMFNRPAVYVALVYVFLPFMILPLYSVMRGISPAYGRAAASLGATPLTVFRRIYLPQVMPGISAGSLLVFIQCLGVYVTPSLLGGPNDQGISTMIAFYVNRSLNWGMAAALSLILIAATIVLYRLYARLAGADTLRMA
jgi:putative spermidine/putrescine transport system permease protein